MLEVGLEMKPLGHFQFPPPALGLQLIMGALSFLLLPPCLLLVATPLLCHSGLSALWNHKPKQTFLLYVALAMVLSHSN